MMTGFCLSPAVGLAFRTAGRTCNCVKPIKMIKKKKNNNNNQRTKLISDSSDQIVTLEIPKYVSF